MLKGGLALGVPCLKSRVEVRLDSQECKSFWLWKRERETD